MCALLALYGVMSVISSRRMVRAFYFIVPILTIELVMSLLLPALIFEAFVVKDGWEPTVRLASLLVAMATTIALYGVILVVDADRELADLERCSSNPISINSP